MYLREELVEEGLGGAQCRFGHRASFYSWAEGVLLCTLVFPLAPDTKGAPQLAQYSDKR